FFKWRTVGRLLKEEAIDVVHAHGTRACSNTYHYARRLGIPLLYTVHGWSFHPDQRPLLKRLRILGERFLVNRTDLTVCVSDNNLRDALRSFPIQRSTVVKYGIDLHKFNPDRRYTDIRRDFGIDEQTVIVG